MRCFKNIKNGKALKAKVAVDIFLTDTYWFTNFQCLTPTGEKVTLVWLLLILEPGQQKVELFLQYTQGFTNVSIKVFRTCFAIVISFFFFFTD
jgi:hypothetical protein